MASADNLVNVRDDTAACDGCLDERVKLLVATDLNDSQGVSEQ